MSWAKIIGQERIKEILGRALKEQRLSHAYFFWGTEGTGKEAAALELAKAANCISPIITERSIEACDICKSCISADKLQHPNIDLVFSLPTGKSVESRSDSPFSGLSDEQTDNINYEKQRKSDDKYHKITIPGANQIKIGSIRALKKNLSMTKNKAGRRFVIISRGDEMTTEAANAFLKTLEEPHENVTIIITSSRHELILPTISSRCQQLHFDNIPDELLSEAMQSRYHLSTAEANLAAAFAQGSLARASEFMNEDMQAYRELLVNVLRAGLKKNIYRINYLDLMSDIISEKDRQKQFTFLSLMLIWMRDAFLIARTGSSDGIINLDQKEILNKFATNFGNRNFQTAIDHIEAAIQQLRGNVMPQLAFTNLIVNLRKVLIGKSS